MLKRLKEKWGVGPWQLFFILWVFAITGTTTAWITGKITGWAGFDEHTPWGWRLLLRLGMLLLGYQLILLTVAFLLGQFPFFWRFEKKLLQRLGILKKDKKDLKEEKKQPI
jgi:O-antigen ligase